MITIKLTDLFLICGAVGLVCLIGWPIIAFVN